MTIKLLNLGSQTKQTIDNLFTHYFQNLCNEMSYQTYHNYFQEKNQYSTQAAKATDVIEKKHHDKNFSNNF